MRDFFKIIGIIYFLTIAGAFLYVVIYLLSECVRKLIWIYKYKHRFDKPPRARCYCKDCLNRVNNHDGKLCVIHDFHPSDDYFCKDAAPFEHDHDKRG